MKGNPGMGGQGQWSECRADAPGRSTGHNRRSQPIRGGPDLGSPRGLPDHAHHEQTFEPGAVILESHGIKNSNTTQVHPDPLHGTYSWTNGHRPPKPWYQGSDA